MVDVSSDLALPNVGRIDGKSILRLFVAAKQLFAFSGEKK